MRAVLVLVLMGCGSPTLVSDAGCDGRKARFERFCGTDVECGVLNHQADCCGSEVVIGVALKGLASAQQVERSCTISGPICRCVAKPTVAEDGKTFADAAALGVRCAAGLCVSFVR